MTKVYVGSSFRISAIIPTYNRKHLIGRAIQSVIEQTYQAHEIIVIDDGSDDGSLEFIRDNFPDVTLISQKNKGVSSARNTGIKRATGNWIALLDSDDEWLPDKLKMQTEVLSKNIDRLVCHTEEIWIRNGKRVNQMKKHTKSGGWIFFDCLALCAMSPSSIVLHRSILEEFSGFDETLPACEDYDLWLKICAKYPVLFISKALIKKYGGHEDQLSRKYWGMDRFRIRALDNLLKYSRLKKEDKENATAMLIKKIDIFVNGAIKRNKKNAVESLIALRAGYSTENEEK